MKIGVLWLEMANVLPVAVTAPRLMEVLRFAVNGAL